MSIKYWFSLHPAVFLWKKKNRCLFYDSEKYSIKQYELVDPNIAKFVESLVDFNNLYCIEISSQELENVVFKEFVSDLVTSDMGKIQQQHDSIKNKPIQLPPLLNIQTEVNRLKKDGITDLTIGENILVNLDKITIILPEQVDISYLEALLYLLDSLEKSLISNLIILNYKRGNDVLKENLARLNNLGVIKTFVFNLNDISGDLLDDLEHLNLFHYGLKIIILPEHSPKQLSQFKKLTENHPFSYEIEYQVVSEENYLRFEAEIFPAFPNSNIQVKPLFTGENSSFFEKYIFTSEDDFQNIELTKKNVFAQQAVNTNDFGKLVIDPDGKVYANLYHPPLGTVHDDIRELLYREMTVGVSWLRVRNEKPCCDCVYQWLCPSPSDYEIQMNKANLCTVTV